MATMFTGPSAAICAFSSFTRASSSSCGGASRPLPQSGSGSRNTACASSPYSWLRWSYTFCRRIDASVAATSSLPLNARASSSAVRRAPTASSAADRRACSSPRERRASSTWPWMAAAFPFSSSKEPISSTVSSCRRWIDSSYPRIPASRPSIIFWSSSRRRAASAPCCAVSWSSFSICAAVMRRSVSLRLSSACAISTRCSSSCCCAVRSISASRFASVASRSCSSPRDAPSRPPRRARPYRARPRPAPRRGAPP